MAAGHFRHFAEKLTLYCELRMPWPTQNRREKDDCMASIDLGIIMVWFESRRNLSLPRREHAPFRFLALQLIQVSCSRAD